MDCAYRSWGVGDYGLADDGAGEVSVADVDLVGIFCFPCPVGAVPFAVGL